MSWSDRRTLLAALAASAALARCGFTPVYAPGGPGDKLYGQIRATAPNARVTVVGYPRIFNGRDCSWFTWFSSSEMSKLNQTADLLNSRLSEAASATGFSFANPTSAFLGHAVCDRAEWINGLSSPISESFHPKVSGHRSGYYPTVSPVVAGATVQLVRTAATASAAAPVSFPSTKTSAVPAAVQSRTACASA